MRIVLWVEKKCRYLFKVSLCVVKDSKCDEPWILLPHIIWYEATKRICGQIGVSSAYKYEQCEKGLLLWVVVFDVPVKGLKIDKTPLPLTILNAYTYTHFWIYQQFTEYKHHEVIDSVNNNII